MAINPTKYAAVLEASTPRLVVADDAAPQKCPFISFDIETDTSDGNGFNPELAQIVAAGLAFNDRIPVCLTNADERALLIDCDDIISLHQGILVTWNGCGFDIPFVNVRASKLGLDLGLRVKADPDMVPKYPMSLELGLPVHARWHNLIHVDIAPLYEDMARFNNITWSLKPVAKFLGFTPVEVNGDGIHDLTGKELRAYNISDAVVTLELANLAYKAVLKKASELDFL
jgi:DNA polymerase elongation subunit (family B)